MVMFNLRELEFARDKLNVIIRRLADKNAARALHQVVPIAMSNVVNVINKMIGAVCEVIGFLDECVTEYSSIVDLIGHLAKDKKGEDN